jgi:dTDP-4-dehydrorhamnose reductase
LVTSSFPYQKILLTGVNGQVGHALQVLLSKHAWYSDAVIALDRTQLDLTDADAIRRVVETIKPDLIINPAAYTAVDKAETEPELAYAINATAPKILAAEAAKIGATLIHFSTDYVYSGTKLSPYTEDDATQPLSVYGKSKLAGEDAIRAVGLPHLIFRTSWVYGAYGNNFLKTILRLASERDALRIVADQLGAPTSSHSIAQAVLEVLNQFENGKPQNEVTGVYHLVNAGQTSWHGFATAIVEEYARLQADRNWPPLKVTPENIQAIGTQDFPTPAARPANSCLDCSKLARNFSVTLPNWRDALAAELQNLPIR